MTPNDRTPPGRDGQGVCGRTVRAWGATGGRPVLEGGGCLWVLLAGLPGVPLRDLVG